MAAEFDIPSRKFDFKKDLAYGQGGESLVSGFLDDLSDGSFEVKSDRYRNGRMVVETDQNPRGHKDELGVQIWKKSGIAADGLRGARAPRSQLRFRCS